MGLFSPTPPDAKAETAVPELKKVVLQLKIILPNNTANKVNSTEWSASKKLIGDGENWAYLWNISHYLHLLSVGKKQLEFFQEILFFFAQSNAQLVKKTEKNKNKKQTNKQKNKENKTK